jgi:hypothetical protein
VGFGAPYNHAAQSEPVHIQIQRYGKHQHIKAVFGSAEGFNEKWRKDYAGGYREKKI